jgi:hypothetical protein
MNPPNFRQRQATRAQLQGQCNQPKPCVILVPLMLRPIRPTPAVATGIVPALFAGGSAAFLLWGSGDKVQNLVAASVFQAATSAALTSFVQIQ